MEGTEPTILVDVYSLIYISGLLAAFFSPLTSVLIAHFSLVPTMRGLYFFAFIMMTAKFITMNVMVDETEHGLDRMRATHGKNVFSIVGESRSVLQEILRSPATLVTGGLLIIVAIATLIQNTFWSVLVTEELLVPPEYLPLYAVARSITMLVFYFTIMPKLRTIDARKPMAFGFGGMILSWLILIVIPPQSYFLLLISVIIEGCSIPAVSTLLDKLVAVTVDPKERARIIAILYVVVLTCTTPFGWIAGQASQLNRNLPFVINIVLLCIGIVLAYTASRRSAAVSG